MLSDFLEPFVRLVRQDTADGVGGVACAWTEGERFQAGVTAAAGTMNAPGELPTLRTTAMLVHQPGMVLTPDERIRRLRDGATFRVIGHSADMETPPCATVRFAQVPVERLVTAP